MPLRLRTLTVTLVGLAVLGVAGCGSDSENAGGLGAEAGAIRVTDVWARSSPMEAENGAVYARIRNTSDRADALIGASVPSSIAATVELHETVMTDTSSEGTHGDGMDDGHGDGMDDGNGDGMDDSGDPGHGSLGVRTVAARPVDHPPAGSGNGTDDGHGGMEMRPVDRITIPADGTRILKPGGYHIMLIDLARALRVGDTFPVTLRFERAGTVKVTAEVRR